MKDSVDNDTKDGPHDSSRPSWNTTILIAAVTLVTSIIASTFLYSSNTAATRSEAADSFMISQANEIENLRKELREIRNEIIAYKEGEERWRLAYIDVLMENLKTKQELAEALSDLAEKINEADIVRQWMDDMPFEGWAKRLNKDGALVIIALNKSFTETYGLSWEEAVGKTDKELFSEEIALEYLETDLEVIKTGIPSIQVDHFIMPDGTKVDIRNIKWRIQFADGTYGSAGMVLRDL